jgi:YD repeat-containing protein
VPPYGASLRCATALVAALVVTLGTAVAGSPPASADPVAADGRDVPATPAALPGTRPRPVPPVPLSSRPLHGRPADARALPDPQPPTLAGPTNAAASIPTATSAAAHSGATDLVATPGFLPNDVSIQFYYNVPDAADYRSWYFTGYDGDGDVIGVSTRVLLNSIGCGGRTQYCSWMTRDSGWPVTVNAVYSVAVTIVYSDGTEVVSARSNRAVARFLLPTTLPTPQTYGCSCPNSSGRSAAFNAARADPVNTATGAFNEAVTDLSMPGPGVAFSATRSYSSDNPSASVLGVGWSWSYDMSLSIDPAGPVAFKAEDGSVTVYARVADGSYRPPPGARSMLSKPDSGYRLLTPEQRTLVFDAAGRLVGISDARGHGLGFSYVGGVLATITDGGGRVVRATMTGGLLTRLTLPDGRFVEYGYTGRLLNSVRDTAGGFTRYAYDADRLATVTDPLGHVLTKNSYDPSTGRVIRQEDALGKITALAWDPVRTVATTTDPDGVTTTDGYTGNVLQYTVNGNLDRTDFRYDERLNPILLTDPLGERVDISYDAAGNEAFRVTCCGCV